ncbi:hypothetical protein C8J56DRAFT_860247 [Mycena floridula]|nr:hypothetical protein C8J56DRAFT_860247 [Mycena floridula]
MVSDSREKSIRKTRLTTILCRNCHSEIHTGGRVDMKQLRAGHYVPSAVEQGEIPNYLVDAERDIELYDQEIQRVSAILDSLKSQRQERQNDALAFKAALSPIRRVPMELWKEIFVQCLDGSPEDLFLTEVCSWWKQMLSSFTEIWSTIIVDLRFSTWKAVSASFDAHRLFSKDTALHLDLRFPLQRPEKDENGKWWADDGEEEHIPAILEKVFSGTRTVLRQLTVTALADSEFGASDYLERIWAKRPLPTCLESTKITFLPQHGYDTDYDRSLYHHLWKCDNLRHLDLSDPVFDYEGIIVWDPDLVKFWGKLETVRLGYCSSIIHDFISRASNLRSMTATNFFPFELAPISSNLQILSVQGRPEALECLLSQITLPIVKSISITVECNSFNAEGFSTANLSRFLGSCGATLETLSLHAVRLNDDDLLVILRSLPNLKHLGFKPIPSNEALTPPCLTGDVYRQMISDPSCSALEALDVSVTPNIIQAFMDLLDARGPGLITATVLLVGYRHPASSFNSTAMVRIEPDVISSFYLRVAALKSTGLAIQANHYPKGSAS